eukprot:scaffold47004_cov52-Phaeocystis_antarctica.AAC.6
MLHPLTGELPETLPLTTYYLPGELPETDLSLTMLHPLTGELPETDLSCVEQIVEHSQARYLVRAIGQAVLELPLDRGHSVRELLAILEAMMMRDGIDALHPRWSVANL